MGQIFMRNYHDFFHYSADMNIENMARSGKIWPVGNNASTFLSPAKNKRISRGAGTRAGAR